ncbi:MAG TPA: ABC transporter permease [Hypericibacter adhaerens]|jgi:ribose transport system permease protein|uniref:ABC transporter permease n=1 Tax=Hypericibacter adhaerens TaxID=2602016 RepID=A0A5J6N662_9PROT|nr:ABC transporter permease [Hypericibacter adhaerens]QEX24183.1 ABC transporter permease [Hypericibacter adhaerens]HWA41935.1 ABC transporter permease [Hypericibacter adhaerens]
MATLAINRGRASRVTVSLARHRGLLIVTAVFLALLFFIMAITPGPFSYFEVSFMSSGSASLALAAMGQTVVILSGGFDLSAGAVVSLINVVLATQMQDTVGSQVLMAAVAIGLGAAVGAFNGFFVAFARLQPIVVTLSTMFLVRGVTLLILDKPGGMIAPGFSTFFTGDAITGILPAPIVLLLVAAAVWFLIKNSRFGTGLYAVGSDEEAARSAGIRVRWVKFFTYTIAGGFYGAAGMFISAQTGGGDPLIGNPVLLQTFTAVVLGGTLLGGGRGGAIGSIIGAYTLTLMVNILLVLNVSAYYSSVTEGVVLVLAVLAGSLNRQSPIARYLYQLRINLKARQEGSLASQLAKSRSAPPLAPRAAAKSHAAAEYQKVPWYRRNAELLRFVMPAYVCLILVVIVTQFVYGGHTIFSWKYYDSLIVLGSFLAILALGQGATILTGGLDLSIPWIIGFCGIIAAGFIRGSDEAALWVIPAVLVIGTLIGAFNGLGVVLLGLPPIVITLATNGILQGFALVYSNGTPDGFSSPTLRWFMTGSIHGVTPVVLLVILFVAFALLLLGRTAFGRRVYAIGNSARVATLSGVGVGGTLIGVYALSGFCAALVGILLTGFSGQASLGMGDEYLLPSIAVVVVGGTLITGGRGHYAGMLGGVLLLTALLTLLAGTTLPHAVRDIIFGLVVLGAVLALRERTS